MEPKDLIDHTVSTMRASMSIELGKLAQGQTEGTVTSEIINIVDRVLQKTSDELKDALNSGYLDGQNERDSWWDSCDPNGFNGVFRGGMPDGQLLPRIRRDGSR